MGSLCMTFSRSFFFFFIVVSSSVIYRHLFRLDWFLFFLHCMLVWKSMIKLRVLQQQRKSRWLLLGDYMKLTSRSVNDWNDCKFFNNEKIYLIVCERDGFEFNVRHHKWELANGVIDLWFNQFYLNIEFQILHHGRKDLLTASHSVNQMETYKVFINKLDDKFFQLKRNLNENWIETDGSVNNRARAK